MTQLASLSDGLAELSSTIMAEKALQTELSSKITTLQQQIAEAQNDREKSIKTTAACEEKAVALTRAFMQNPTGALPAQQIPAAHATNVFMQEPLPKTSRLLSMPTLWSLVSDMLYRSDFPAVTVANQPSAVHHSFPTILFIADTWIELRCEQCGANAGLHTDARFFSGLNGFHRHISQSHGNGLRLCEVLDFCEGRVVSNRDVELMSRGREPLEVAVVKMTREGRA